ncbi:MAG: helix-turn-helix domain-containing protein, partial [Roseibacillus sp.]|nr:helix-turn-helix domain-containing protein [Roseibacillus sp.]
ELSDLAHLKQLFEAGGQEEGAGFEVGTSLASVEREMIVRTLEAYRGNKKKTSEILGIDRRTLYNKLEAYGIKIERRATVVGN